MTYLTVPIAAKNIEQAGRQIKAAFAAGAEMLELRTDYLENLSVDLVKKLIAEARDVAKASIPLIVTCRDKGQGGAISYSQQLRTDVLVAALKAGVEYVDFEYANFFTADNQEKLRRALSASSKGRLILSAHNFETKFDNIGKLYRGILNLYSAAIPKLVYTAKHINDCFDAFDLLHKTSGQRIVLCMGNAGLISRILAKKLGSLVTFASIDDEAATAPGQTTIAQFKNLYRYDSISSETELYGVIASPVAHSLSPAVHNVCFADIDVNKLYLPLLVEGKKAEFDRFMDNIFNRPWLDFRGFSVTIPHKENALNYVRQKQGFIEPLAKKIAAVNTLLIKKDGSLKAYNTDYSSALDSITSGMGIGSDDLKDLPVAVIGAGGVARAIVAGLSDVGAKITVYNRTVRRAENLASEFDCAFAPLEDLSNVDAKLVINCTSIGMYPGVEATPLPEEYLKKSMAVFDTVYNPVETLLLKQAKTKKAKTIDGISMFVNQAAAQFKLFTGKDANADLMRKTICDRI